MRSSSRGQRGQAIVLIALMLAVLVGMTALAIDGSRAYSMRRDLQAAIDAAALGAADNLQQTASYTLAEQAASTIFGVNLRLYASPSCTPGYGVPGAGSFSVTCTYSDGTKLIQVVSNLGPAGSQFALTATRSLSLQFARILTNGTTPTISSVSAGAVNNLLYSPTVAALAQNGCGGAGGSAISIGGSGSLSVLGDVVSSGAISISTGSMAVAGDIYARCQSSVPGATTYCYPSGAATPCTYPDVAGVTRSGYHFVDPNYPAPPISGTSQGLPGSNVQLQPGTYTALPFLFGRRCYFLAAGVYDWSAGYVNLGDFVSNELKPPDEPLSSNNAVRSPHQFWDTDGTRCSGGVQVAVEPGPGNIPLGRWSFVVTSTRTDTYNGNSYVRESAPSMCYQATIDATGEVIEVTVSNVPGATAYRIYAARPGSSCAGPFGLAETLPVSGPVQNSNTAPCPAFNGNGCSLGYEAVDLNSSDLGPPFAPNAAAGPGVPGSYQPNPETSPLTASLPNQNPPTGPGATGDRANENNCDSVVGVYVSCPAPVTPGAVVYYLPSPECFVNIIGGDDYYFSGYQYNWMALYEPGAGSPPANTCGALLGANSNSTFIGLLYTPAAPILVSSPYAFESPGIGGVIANTISFSGSLPAMSYSAAYAPVPFAARLVS